MRTRNVARDSQTQSGAAFVLIARIVEPQERPKHFLAHLRRDAWPVIVDADREPAMIAMTRDGYRLGKARRVRDQVAEAAPQGRLAHRDERVAVERDARLVAV